MGFKKKRKKRVGAVSTELVPLVCFPESASLLISPTCPAATPITRRPIPSTDLAPAWPSSLLQVTPPFLQPKSIISISSNVHSRPPLLPRLLRREADRPRGPTPFPARRRPPGQLRRRERGGGAEK